MATGRLPLAKWALSQPTSLIRQKITEEQVPSTLLGDFPSPTHGVHRILILGVPELSRPCLHTVSNLSGSSPLLVSSKHSTEIHPRPQARSLKGLTLGFLLPTYFTTNT